MLRKYILARPKEPAAQGAEIPIASVATVYVTSEAMDHPIDHAFDNSTVVEISITGRGGFLS